MAVYEVGEFREVMEGYFFEIDSLGNIHVYTKDLSEYLDMIDLDFRIDREEFLFKCKEWIGEHGRR